MYKVEDSNFEGYDFYEIAEFFGITQEQVNVFSNADMTLPESIDKTLWVGGVKVVVSTRDEEEVVVEKLINFLWDNIDIAETNELANNIREILNAFLDKLIENSEDDNFNTPVLKGIREIEDDFTFLKWFTRNLTSLWV